MSAIGNPDYEPPRHIAVCNRSSLVNTRDVAYWAEATRLQLLRHAAPAWATDPPGVYLYDKAAEIPKNTGLAAVVVDDDGDDEAAGLHGELAGVPYILIDARQSRQPDRTLSHEALEVLRNQHLREWALNRRNGLRYAVELGDPFQALGYSMDVTLFGRTRTVTVSDFALPSWFEFESGLALRTDHLGSGMKPFEVSPGGYAIALDDYGEVKTLPDRDGKLELAPRKSRLWSRTQRLLLMGRAP